MATKSISPKEIPVEPRYYQFTLNARVNKKQRKCMQTAINRYDKRCEKAYLRLINDLKKCIEENNL
jgi:hypothetical protein